MKERIRLNSQSTHRTRSHPLGAIIASSYIRVEITHEVPVAAGTNDGAAAVASGRRSRVESSRQQEEPMKLCEQTIAAVASGTCRRRNHSV